MAIKHEIMNELNTSKKWVPSRKSGPFGLIPNALSPRVACSRALEWLHVIEKSDPRRLIGIDLLWDSFERGYSRAGRFLADERRLDSVGIDETGLSREDAARILTAWALSGWEIPAMDLHYYYSDLFTVPQMIAIFEKNKHHTTWCLETYEMYVEIEGRKFGDRLSNA
jgi:hypothetical protein